MKKYLDIFFSFFRVGGLTFGGGLAMLPILILYLFLQKHIVAGVTAGAVKG